MPVLSERTLPSEWVVSTNTETNITFHNSSDRQTITIIQTNTEWVVKGLTGFEAATGGEYPVFTQTTDKEHAIDTATTVISTGVQAVDYHHEQQNDEFDKTPETKTKPVSEDSNEQPTLESFTEEADMNSDDTTTTNTTLSTFTGE